MRKSVDQRTLLTALSQFSQRDGDEPLSQFCLGRRPNCDQRQEIAGTTAGGELRLDHCCQKRLRTRSILELPDDLTVRRHRRPFDPLVLLPKPTLAGQKGWDRLVLELR